MKLYSFQERAVEQMVKFLTTNSTAACYNASEMGTGKTCMAINTAMKLYCKDILIICPAIMRYVWKEEIEKWCEKSAITIWFNTINPDLFSKGKINWTICSYDLAYRSGVLGRLQDTHYDMVIYDEAHYLKNRKAKRTRAALANLWPRGTYHILLSGTPFTTRVIDGFNTFHKCSPGDFPNFYNFAERFSYIKQTPFGLDYYGVKQPEELSRLIRSKFYLRITKKEALPELPDKIFERIILPSRYAVVPKAKNEADEIRLEIERVTKFIEDGKEVIVPKSLAEHRRLQGEAKVEPIVEFVKNLLDQDIPTVLYAWHKNVIAAFEDAFREYHPAVITGETSAKDRATAVDEFQQRHSTNLFLGNMAAAGIGITLTRSSTIVLAELDWSPATVSQAIDRLHRIGQKNSVLIYYFVVRNSLDESLTNVVMNRARTFNSILNKEKPNGENCREDCFIGKTAEA